jgi:hypothetical protein
LSELTVIEIQKLFAGLCDHDSVRHDEQYRASSGRAPAIFTQAPFPARSTAIWSPQRLPPKAIAQSPVEFIGTTPALPSSSGSTFRHALKVNQKCNLTTMKRMIKFNPSYKPQY